MFSAALSQSVSKKLWYFGIRESTRFTRFKVIVNYCVWNCYQNIILSRSLYGNCKRDFQYNMDESFIPRKNILFYLYQSVLEADLFTVGFIHYVTCHYISAPKTETTWDILHLTTTLQLTTECTHNTEFIIAINLPFTNSS